MASRTESLESRTVGGLTYLSAMYEQTSLFNALKKKFGVLHAYHIRPEEDLEVIYYVKQSDGEFKGYLLATLEESVTKYHKNDFSKNVVQVKIIVETRPLKRSEYDVISESICQPDEPHDYDNFKNDVFKVEEDSIKC